MSVHDSGFGGEGEISACHFSSFVAVPEVDWFCDETRLVYRIYSFSPDYNFLTLDCMHHVDNSLTTHTEEISDKSGTASSAVSGNAMMFLESQTYLQ